MKLKPLRPGSGPIRNYLGFLSKKESEDLQIIIRNLLSTPDGVIFMDLLEKSLVFSPLGVRTDPRALEFMNAQSFIFHDLNRIVSEDAAYVHPPNEERDSSERS
jgi:hypothetical protein